MISSAPPITPTSRCSRPAHHRRAIISVTDRQAAARDRLAALRLQLAWGADEALAEAPQDRLRAPIPSATPLPTPLGATLPPDGPAVAGQPLAPPQAFRRGGGEAAARAWELAARAASREELRAALAAFDGCALAATATNLVFSDGNPDAGLVLIGEAPGAEEDRTGLPFVGAAGQLLDAMLASIGLDRGKVLILNVLPWRPPGNRTPSDEEITICLPFLLRHLVLVRPLRLVLLGALSTRALTGRSEGIRRLRGRWTEVSVPGLEKPVPALPTYHPAYLLRTQAAKREAWADLLALRRALDADIEKSQTLTKL